MRDKNEKKCLRNETEIDLELIFTQNKHNFVEVLQSPLICRSMITYRSMAECMRCGGAGRAPAGGFNKQTSQEEEDERTRSNTKQWCSPLTY